DAREHESLRVHDDGRDDDRAVRRRSGGIQVRQPGRRSAQRENADEQIAAGPSKLGPYTSSLAFAFFSAARVTFEAAPLVSLNAISTAYGHLPLVDAASMQIEPGERVALVGRNGSGKSTLLRIISGEVPPDSGAVWRQPGLRVARLEQDVPISSSR